MFVSIDIQARRLYLNYDRNDMYTYLLKLFTVGVVQIFKGIALWGDTISSVAGYHQCGGIPSVL